MRQETREESEEYMVNEIKRKRSELDLYDFFEMIDIWTDWDAFYKEYPELRRKNNGP